jgi:hypothetical protein
MVVVQNDPEHAGLLKPVLGIDPRLFLELPFLTALIRHRHILLFRLIILRFIGAVAIAGPQMLNPLAPDHEREPYASTFNRV